MAETKFTIIGAGAIGSFLTMTLAKMGATQISVYDMDTLEEHNIANQMYPEYEVGRLKVEALHDVVKSYSGIDMRYKAERFTENILMLGTHCVISAVDNMDVRKVIFNQTKASGAKYFIDGRMGALSMRAYSVDMQKPDEVAFYERTLYSQDRASPERCTAKSIIFTVLIVAGYMLDMLAKRINGQECPTEIMYDSPSGYQSQTKAGQEAI